MSKNKLIAGLKKISKEDGLENTAGKVGISTGHFSKIINKPDQYRLTKKMKDRIESSGLIDV